MPTFRDAANGLADAFEAGIAHTHPEAVTRLEFDSLAERVAQLEAAPPPVPDPPDAPPQQEPPPPPEDGPAQPWDAARVGPAQAIAVPDRWERVSTPEGLRDALRSGYSVMLRERQRLGGYSFEIADGAWLRAEGDGAWVFGNGRDKVLRPAGRGCAHNIVIEGLNQGSTNEDGVSPQTGADYWLDKCALRLTHDERIDFWNPGRKRLTVTRSAILGDDGHEYGPIMGSKDNVPVDQWLVMWRTYLETRSRHPLVAAPGAVAHLVNTVHGYWMAGAPYAIDVKHGGVAILDGPIFGSDNTGGGDAARVSSGVGGIYVTDPMLLDGDVRLMSSSAVPRPQLPYDPIPWEYRQSLAERRALATQITDEAGPRIAHESGYFVRRAKAGI